MLSVLCVCCVANSYHKYRVPFTAARGVSKSLSLFSLFLMLQYIDITSCASVLLQLLCVAVKILLAWLSSLKMCPVLTFIMHY
jgi:hypothetical protein